ncbi:MAG TPA: carboxypeptidase regulatory-like domain-containing protein [Bacteroidota bacterium]|nr:carboxypeptidase regulatory-like domain-containing protein [Bacteroidota bacterium]
MIQHRTRWSAILIFVLLAGLSALHAQGVTTAGMYGSVLDKDGNPLPGANIIALHTPSGTTYGTTSREDGSYNLPGLRVGGPYTLTVSFVGYTKEERTDLHLQLGQSLRQDFRLTEEAVQVGVVEVTAERSALLNADRTGAGTSVSRQAIATLPTISRRIEDFVRLTPQYSGAGFGFSFAGQDNRLNNVTVDGSYFNNSFGLAGQPGDRTGVAPISLDAIEQVQVNIAPYDVRQGNFVGAGVNTVTRSGTNNFAGSIYYQRRHNGLVGTKAKANNFDPGKFEFNQFGINVSGPIIENKLFFFTSFENENTLQPGTTFRANKGGEPVGGTVTRVLESDLITLSNYLKTNFGYDTGPYQGYDFETPGLRFLARLDYNLDERNKISLRYTHLDSDTDVLVSNSSSLGFGNRRSNTTGLNFKNSNYKILENIRSVVGEWNAILADNMSNSLIVGYSYHDESREPVGQFFPMVDILNAGTVYTTFGFEPFTPNNELRYSSLQLQDNFSMYLDKHYLTFGLSVERYESENVFFPGSQSVYVYNSLADFYTDANGYLANPNRTVSPVTLRRFQVRWSNIPGQTKPIQPLEVFYAGVYAQDEYRVMDNLKLTLGLRLDVPFFGDTGYENPLADALVFRDEKGNNVQYKTKKLPDPNILWSPRLGFNYDVMGDRSTQVRGGTGIFTGRPAYVWISNQIGNTGVLTGFEQRDNTTTRPFHPDPNHYKPTNVTGAPASSYELALTDPDFKFPQLWRSNIAIDQALPFDFVGTVEFLYSKDVNGVYYINANLPAPQTRFNGVDQRPRWTSNRIYSNVANAIVLKNQDVGSSWNIAATLEYPYRDGLFAKIGYSYGEAKNTVDPGSIAFGSWNNNQHAGDPNNPGLGFAATSPGNRIFAAVSYRREYFDIGATTIAVFFEGRPNGSASYVFSGDINGDGGTSNDLIYIPRDASEMNFEQFTSGTRTFTVAEQQAAWEAFIKQDPYLSKNRGKYAERGAVFTPMVYRADLSITQEVFTELLGGRNSLQLRADFLNITNLINKDWGVGQRFVTTSPLIARPPDAQGRILYRLRNIGTELISKTFEPSATISDVFRIQLGVRYSFN